MGQRRHKERSRGTAGRALGVFCTGMGARRGAALLIAIVVLASLFLLAVPFATYMRLQHRAATQALQMVRARSAESGALSHAHAVLYHGPDAAEVANPVFPFHAPDVDALWEFRVTLRTRLAGVATQVPPGVWVLPLEDVLGFPNDGNSETVDGYIRVDDGQVSEWMGYSHVLGLEDAANPGEPGVLFPGGVLVVRPEHRGLFGTQQPSDWHLMDPQEPLAIVSFFPDSELWALDIEDQQAKISINTAPYRVILNLLGYLRIGGGSPADPITGDPGVDFSTPRQRDLATAISSYRIYYSYWNDQDQIAPGDFTRFQNVSMIKNISWAPWFTSAGGAMAPLSAEEFDLIRPYITVSSASPGGDPWFSAGATLAVDLNPLLPTGGETYEWAAQLLDASSIPVGSIVRLLEGVNGNVDYRIITAVNRDVDLVDSITAAYTGWVQVTGPLDQFRQVAQSDGSLPYTPGYLYVEDAATANEWIEYSEVDASDPGNLLVYISQRNAFGTTPAVPHAGTMLMPIPMHGHVISWRYLHSTGGTDYTVSIPDTGPDMHTYSSANTTIEFENRHAININTVTDPLILRSILLGVNDGTNEIVDTPVDPEAGTVAAEMISYTSAGGPISPPPYDFFNGDEVWFGDYAELESFFDVLAVSATIDQAQADMLKLNFDPHLTNGPWPAVSTVPLRFNSGTMIGIDSLGIVDDRAGAPVAQFPPGAVVMGSSVTGGGAKLGRVYDVVPPLEPLQWLLRSQKEFLGHIRDTLLSSNVFTNERNEALPPPADDGDFVNVNDGIGTVAPALDTLNDNDYTTVLEGLHETPPDFELDFARGDAAEVDGIVESVANTTSQGIGNVQLEYDTDYDELSGLRNIEADGFHATIQPFAVEFWIRPTQIDLTGTGMRLLVDVGEGEAEAATASNQVRLYLDGGQLVLRMDDQLAFAAPVDPANSYGGYVTATSSLAFEPEEWHHVAVAAVGPFSDEIAMFIDGVYDDTMDWTYHYATGAAGTEATATEATVQEGYLWPVGMTIPDVQYLVQVQCTAGTNQVTLNNVAGLPIAGGMISIDSSGDYYEYSGIAVTTLTLTSSLTIGYPVDTAVAFMIPVRRPAVHNVPDDAAAVPVLNDGIALWGHTHPAGIAAFTADPPGDMVGPHTILSTAITATTPLDEYLWLGIDPASFPLGVGVGALQQFDILNQRWKVLNHTEFVTNHSAVLTGVLPSDPGDFLSVGGDLLGTAVFQGELDELRITVLPTGLVADGGWVAGASSALVQEWQLSADASYGWLMTLKDSPSSNLAVALGVAPLHPTGGYFMVQGELYSYSWYDANPVSATYGHIFGIGQVNDNLTPNIAAAPGVAPGGHPGLHRIIPLNFITSTRLAAGGYLTGAVDIPVEDAGQFPDRGYVRISSFDGVAIHNEIIAYSGRDTTGTPHLLLRPSYDPDGAGPIPPISAYPRGAYGTMAADHDVHPVTGYMPVVRHLPVRHLDRYRVGGWVNHDGYSAAQLNSQMCMFSFTVNHGGQLREVEWQFKEPLEDGQKVAVLVRIDDDPASPWDSNPQDTADPRISADLLWGTIISEGPGTQHGSLSIYTTAGENPTVNTKVEVRFYFDLGDTDPYGWSNMVELDKVEIEMVPRRTTF